MTTADALPADMPGLRAAALALLAERDELLRRVDRIDLAVQPFADGPLADFCVRPQCLQVRVRLA